MSMSDYNYNSFGMSPIRRRNPIGMNINAFADAVTRLDSKYQDMAKQQSAIDIALGQLPVNAAEDEWRMQLGDEIRQQINSVDNPNDRYLTAIKAAGNIMARPDVIGRIRAQADYKNFVEQTQKRNDIDQRTKNWAIATNPYSYQDTRDASGRIVGGSEWKPTNTPVANVNLASLGSLAIQWAKPDEYKGSNATFTDAYGNFTNDISKAADMVYQTESGWKKVGKDKLMKAINAAIDMTPGARASIEQDYKVAQWDYNKLTPEERANIGETEITDSNGRLLTKQEFLAKKLNPWADAASYENKETTIKYGSGLQTAFALRQQGLGGGAGNGSSNIFSPTGEGYAVTYDRSDEINQASGILEDSVSSIANVAPGLANTPQWKRAVESKNYEAIERLVKNSVMRDGKNYYNALKPEAQRIIDRALTNIYSNKDFVQNVHKTMDNDTRNAFDFKCAVDAGQKSPNNNTYVREINTLLNNMTGGKAAQQYQIRFNSNEDVDLWLQNLGMTRGTAKNNGFDFGSEDDRPIVTYNAGSNFNIKSIVALAQNRDDVFHNPFKETELRALDSNGNIIGTSGRSSGVNIGYKPVVLKINDLYQRAVSAVSRYNSGRNGVLMTTNQSVLAELPVVAEARARGDKPSDISAIKKDAYDTLKQKFDGDWAQMTVYGINDDTRTLTNLHNEDRGGIMHDVKAHLQTDKADIQLMQSGPLIGYAVTVHGKLDKDGVIKDDGQDKTYFITTGVTDPLLEEFKNDPSTRANINYTRRIGVGGAYRTKLGVNISNIDNDTCYINGKRANSGDGKRLILLDELMTNLQVNPNDKVSAAKILSLIGNNQELTDRINNYLTNN